MSSQIAIANEPQSLEATNLMLQDGEEEDLTGLVLGLYQLTGLLRRENHYNVYSVFCWFHYHTLVLEARSYVLEGIHSKLRKYRLKSIQRLSSRNVREEKLRGLFIVVYKVESQIANELEKTKPSQILHHRMKDIQVSKPTEKSDRQREATRLRQLERRQKNRRKEKSGSEEKEGEEEKEAGHDIEGRQGEGEGDREGSYKPADEEERLYALLYNAYYDRPTVLQKLPSVSQVLLEKYIRNPPPKFEDVEQMEAFTATKFNELLFLSEQEMNLPAKVQQRKDEYAKSILRQILTTKESEDYDIMQDVVAMAHHEIEVIMQVQQILPGARDIAEFRYLEWTKKLKKIRDLKTKIEDQEAEYAEWTRLHKQQDDSRVTLSVSGTVVALMGSLFSLRLEYRKLLYTQD